MRWRIALFLFFLGRNTFASTTSMLDLWQNSMKWGLDCAMALSGLGARGEIIESTKIIPDASPDNAWDALEKLPKWFERVGEVTILSAGFALEHLGSEFRVEWRTQETPTIVSVVQIRREDDFQSALLAVGPERSSPSLIEVVAERIKNYPTVRFQRGIRLPTNARRDATRIVMRQHIPLLHPLAAVANAWQMVLESAWLFWQPIMVSRDEAVLAFGPSVSSDFFRQRLDALSSSWAVYTALASENILEFE